MMILLTGNTWYGKYGFRPYNNSKNIINERLDKKYNNNKIIMDVITIKEANIVKYIKMTGKESLIKSVEKLVKEQPNYLLKDFIKSFLEKYDKTCKYFLTFYEDLFDDIKLTNFHGGYFGLHLS